MSGFGSDDSRRGGQGPGPGGGWPGAGSGQARPDWRKGHSVRVYGEGVRPGSEPRPGSFEAEQQRGQTGTPQPPSASEPRRPAAGAPTPVEAPTPTMPTGGGAIRPIAEKFSANPATGTGSMSVPIATPEGRSGFGPTPALGYDSAGGNGPFGLGWSLSVPAISRKTDKGVPRYRDDRDSDTFVLSGAEDLVPKLVEESGSWIRETVTDGDLRRERYRPRVEAEFARIERVTDTTTGNVYWQATTKDNVTSTYGQSAQARIAHPSSERLVFRWLLEQTRDDRGNVVRYEYQAEDLQSVPTAVCERRRHEGKAPIANRYLKRILYGNRQGVSEPTEPTDFHFEVVLDYGEHDPDAPSAVPTESWPARQDPFSTYRAGFEIRTYRLCRRILCFHRFSELGPEPLLVSSTDLSYEEEPALTYLRSVTHRGYLDGSTATAEAMPAVRFDYSRAELQTAVTDMDADSVRHLPAGVDGRRYQWTDLDGEGVPGVLSQQGRALYYQRNLGQGRLAPALALRSQPTGTALGSAQALSVGGGLHQLVDVTGDGRPDLVSLGGPKRGGFHARSDDEDWAPFRPFRTLPKLDWSDPSLRFIDLTGDGFADVVLSENHVYTWYPSLREQGYGPPRRAPRTTDENRGPAVVFAEAEQTVFVADMSGDGLQDLVRIRNGSVCYWPNLGHGRFGAKVMMSGVEHFAPSNLYRPARVRLADIDGTGTADLLYIGPDGVHVWRNQAGNSFAARQRLAVFPSADGLSSTDVVDLLGTGTSCLVWSTPLRGKTPQVRYVDLLGSVKPHLLTKAESGLGLETRIQYTPSTRFYLEDRAAGRTWATRLPFPVQVVERVEHYDHVSKHRFASTYRYRHGYYDAEEREFRGFGYVEQRDAESVGAELGKGLFPDYPVENGELSQPPVVTKSWFHTGAWRKRQRLHDAFETEWFDTGAGEPRLSMPPLPAPAAGETTAPSLSPPEYHQAYRALAGRLLRQEIYAEDGSASHEVPYLVTQQTWSVRRLQPLGVLSQAAKAIDDLPTAPYAAFLAFESETLSLHYERDTSAPRIGHELVLFVDELGYLTQSASVGYGHPSGGAFTEQDELWVSATEQSFAHELAHNDWLRHGVPLESKIWQLGSALAPAPGELLTVAEVRDALSTFTPVDYDAPLGASQKRLLSHTRERYWQNNRLAPLDFGQIESLALPYQSYALALTPTMLSGPLGGNVDAATVTGEGGYEDLDSNGYYWARSGVQRFLDEGWFYQLDMVADPFGNETTLGYDTHRLLVTTAADALGNQTSAEHDYRVLAPRKVTGPNGNWSEAAFDALGRVTAIAVVGKLGEGDSLAEPTTSHTYELLRFQSAGLPARIKTERRETHADSLSRWLVSYHYLSGSGAEVAAKVQAEAGPAWRVEAGEFVEVPHADPRWVGTGRTVVDNKGNPVKQYEPFFSTTHEYEDDDELRLWGVTPLLHYDPLGRLVRTDFPDGSYARVEFSPWEQVSYDQNDTVLEPGNLWYQEHTGSSEATKAAAHADTPSRTYFDSLGRAFLVRQHNRVGDPPADVYYDDKTVLDIQGNVLSVIDAKGRDCMSYTYGVLGQVLVQESIDAGSRWRFATAAGEPVRTWGQRSFTHRTSYDELRRPTHKWVREGATPEVLAERLVYGEQHASAPTNNLRGRLVQHYDQAGVALTESYDFKGNLLTVERRLGQQYDVMVDWSALAALTDPAAILSAAAPLLETESFQHQSAFDALDRPTSVTTPDQSEVLPSYSIAGLLESVEAKVRGAVTPTGIVTSIDYDEKGRRTEIAYANGTTTSYAYHELTFRLASFETTRSSDGKKLQSLAYTHDPVGNIVHTADAADQDVYFDATTVPSADGDYVYDALYRLIEAQGREHASGAEVQRDEVGLPIHSIPHPNDPSGLRTYTRGYDLDEVGNLTEMRHRLEVGEIGEWTRVYTYEGGSNRLATTSHPGGDRSYTHDAHGNMTAMPHLAAITWDYLDRMREVDLGGGGTVHFVYDASGQRMRKVWEHASYRDERIYLGGYEVWRRTVIATGTLQDERETLHVADDARRVAMVETLTVSGGSAVGTPVPRYRFQLDNHLGTACVEADNAGAVISYEEYHPYGTSSYRSFTSPNVSDKRYRYTGKERDEETGLYYHGARYYAAWLGRWTAADPAGLVDGPGLYNYVRGSPVVLSDPSGGQSQPHPYFTHQPGVPQGQGAPSTIPEQEQGGQGAGPGGPVPQEEQGELAHPEEVGRQAAEANNQESDRLYALSSERDEAIRSQEMPTVRKGTGPGTGRTKEESVQAALGERGKAAGIRRFDEEALNAFLIVTAIWPSLVELGLATFAAKAGPMVLRPPSGRPAPGARPGAQTRPQTTNVPPGKARTVQAEGPNIARPEPKPIPNATRLTEAEQATAGRFMSKSGHSLRESAHKGAEYVDDWGRSYDALGTPAASKHWSERHFLRSIDKHINKSNDFTIVDLTGFTDEQIAAVRAHLNSLPPSAQARIKKVGF